MRCEACGYQFLLASSTKCPDCGDPREDIVPELKRLGDSAFLPAEMYDSGRLPKRPDGTLLFGPVRAARLEGSCHCPALPGDGCILTAAECEARRSNAPSNALTNIECQPKRPFEHDPAVIAITDEMENAGRAMAEYDSGGGLANAGEVYCAMAASAPPGRERLRLADRNIHIASLEAANAHLTRQLAAQALAHAEQMEGLKEDREKARRENVALGEIWAKATMRITDLETQITMQDSIYADRPGTLFSARQKIATERDVALARVAELETENAGLTAAITRGASDDLDRVRILTDRIKELEEKGRWLEAECKHLADGPPTRHPPEYVARVLMDREGRSDSYEHARLTEVIRCARLDGRKQARDQLAAMRVTPARQPAPDPKAFPAGALKTGGSDPRRVGG